MEKTELKEKFARASAAEKELIEKKLPIIKKMYDFISELRDGLGTQEIGFEVVAPEKINSSDLCGLINIKNKKFLIRLDGSSAFYLSIIPVKDEGTIENNHFLVGNTFLYSFDQEERTYNYL